MNRLLYIISFLLCALAVSAQSDVDDKLDSMVVVYNSLDDSDTARLNVSLKIAALHYNTDSTILWSNRTVSLAKIHNNAYIEGLALAYLSWAYYYNDEFEIANDCNYASLLIADSINSDFLKAKNYEMLGNNYSYLKNYDQADNYYHLAIEFFGKINDTVRVTPCMRFLADNLINQKLFAKGEEVLNQAIRLDSLNRNAEALGEDYLAMGFLKVAINETHLADSDPRLICEAKRYMTKSCEYISDIESNFSLLDQLSSILFLEAHLLGYKGKRLNEVRDSMKLFIDMGFAYDDKVNIGSDRLCFDFNLIKYYILSGDFGRAKFYLDSISDYMQQNENSVAQKFSQLYAVYDNYYSAIGDYKSAYYYRSKFYDESNSTISLDFAVKAAQNLSETQFKQKLRQRELDEQHRERIANLTLIVILLVLAFMVIEYFRNRKSNRALNEKNIMLMQQKEEILSQKEEISAQSDELMVQYDKIATQNKEISHKNKQITDSINYASLIQKAVLPKDSFLRSMFKDYFLIYKPLDIVAGDFYWANKIGNWKILVCADSTGHGVPGAFVSMLGISMLNEMCTKVVLAGGNAADILNELRSGVMYSLGQSRDFYKNGQISNMDGMDMSLVMVDSEKHIINYAGAYRPLWIFRNGEISIYQPDRMPVGLYFGEEKQFTNNVISFEDNDVLYMFSDGIPDQFGFTDESKTAIEHFSTRKLASIIKSVGALPMQEQKNAIETACLQWMKGYRQLDDNILIGVRL